MSLKILLPTGAFVAVEAAVVAAAMFAAEAVVPVWTKNKLKINKYDFHGMGWILVKGYDVYKLLIINYYYYKLFFYKLCKVEVIWILLCKLFSMNL